VHVTKHTVHIEPHGRTPFEATKEATTEIHRADGGPSAQRARGRESAHGLGCPSNDDRAGELASPVLTAIQDDGLEADSRH
jgi:hypothetical protein